jgi:hypothetical protein
VIARHVDQLVIAPEQHHRARRDGSSGLDIA